MCESTFLSSMFESSLTLCDSRFVVPMMPTIGGYSDVGGGGNYNPYATVDNFLGGRNATLDDKVANSTLYSDFFVYVPAVERLTKYLTENLKTNNPNENAATWLEAANDLLGSAREAQSLKTYCEREGVFLQNLNMPGVAECLKLPEKFFCDVRPNDFLYRPKENKLLTTEDLWYCFKTASTLSDYSNYTETGKLMHFHQGLLTAAKTTPEEKNQANNSMGCVMF